MNMKPLLENAIGNISKILTKLQEFSETDSVVALIKLLSLEVIINEFDFGNHIGLSYIMLREEIARKHGCVIGKTCYDNACFTRSRYLLCFLLNSIWIEFLLSLLWKCSEFRTY